MKFRWNLVTIVYFTVLVVKTKSQSKPFDFYLLFIYLSTFLEIRRNKKMQKRKEKRGKRGKRSKKYCSEGAVIQIAESSEGGLLKTNKYGLIYLVRTQNFPKNNISLQIHTCTCAYQAVRNNIFSKNFAYILNE